MVRRNRDLAATVLADTIRPGTRRGLDFILVEELRKRTGITTEEVLKFALAEILCNALDKDDATEIKVDVQTEGEFHRLATEEEKEEEQPKEVKPQEEVEVTLDNRHYGRCPRCHNSFNYDESDVGRLVRCRGCNLPMRLRLKASMD